MAQTQKKPPAQPKPKAPEKPEDEAVPVVQTKDVKGIAANMVDAKLRRDAQQRIDRIQRDLKENVYTLACNRNHSHVGIFFTVDPRTTPTITPGMWYSVYHSNEEPWYHPLERIVCQECLADTGEKVPLRVAYAGEVDGGVCIRVQPRHFRFVRAVPRSQLTLTKELKEVAS